MSDSMKKFWKLYSALTALFVLLVVGSLYLIGYFEPAPEPEPAPAPVEVAEPEVPVVVETEIGRSVELRPISATTIGNGDTHLLVVGGIHGGYEWNSALLAYELIDYYTADPSLLPDTITLTIVPDLNPDATTLATGVEGRFALSDVIDPDNRLAAGRFTVNGVDLNRNFDCKWQSESTWRGNVVSAGSAPFSEPEAAAIRDWVVANTPAAAIFLHSQANNVYASECEEGVLPETLTLMSTYAKPANYGEVPVFDAYPITGDVEGWLASIGIPAVTVELETFNTTEFTRNLAGLTAVLELYK